MKVIKIVSTTEVFYGPPEEDVETSEKPFSVEPSIPFEDVKLLSAPPRPRGTRAVVFEARGSDLVRQANPCAVPHAIGVMGHELRNPLSSIVAVIANLLGGHDLTEEQRRRLIIIQRSARRMAELIERALDYAAMGATGHLRLSRQPVDLHAICEEAIGELLARNPGAAVHLEMSGNGVGNWDGGRLAQVVSNLLTNALIHGSTDAPIVVFVRRAGDQVILEVRNRGPIIAGDVLPRLFEPFRRGAEAPSLAGRRTGLGLGLHIVKQIAEAHGGSISARSSAEEGTVFILSLPASERALVALRTPAALSQTGG